MLPLCAAEGIGVIPWSPQRARPSWKPRTWHVQQHPHRDRRGIWPAWFATRRKKPTRKSLIASPRWPQPVASRAPADRARPGFCRNRLPAGVHLPSGAENAAGG